MIKPVFLVMSLLLMSGMMMDVSAVHSSSAGPAMTAVASPVSAMTVNDFLALDIKGYRTADGRKMKWTHRLAMNMTQKNLARKVRKGKIDAEAPMSSVMAAQGSSKFGLLSVIFAVGGLVVPFLGLAMIVAGLILGIIGIRRDTDPTLAIIGTVLSGIFILFLLIALVAFVSGAWWWW